MHAVIESLSEDIEHPSIYKKNFIIGVLIISICFMDCHHLFSEIFFRKLNKIWDENIEEDVHEEFNNSNQRSGCLCCLSQLSVMRYFNFLEWISLWKKRGYVIPEDHQLLRDMIQVLFLKSIRLNMALNYLLKYVLISILILVLKFDSSTRDLFIKNERGEINYSG